MIPDAQYAAELCRRLLGKSPRKVTRFRDGLCHYVFEARFVAHEAVVVRLAEESARAYMAGGIYWSPRLRALGVPVPKLLHADAQAQPFAYMLLERIAGNDLIHVYESLTIAQKQTLATQLAAIQRRVATMPIGGGFGNAFSEDGPFASSTWRGVLEQNLARSLEWLAR